MTFFPQGFQLAVTAAGFKTPGRPDLSLAFSDRPAVAAGVFTTNLFKAAPVRAGMDIISSRAPVRGIIINTGQANACTGTEGLDNCRATQELLAAELGVAPSELLPGSTGVIGVQLKMANWRTAAPALVRNLGLADLKAYAEAIMTTDAFPKYACERLDFDGKPVVLSAAAKGAGMICPNMATMLSVVLCDAAVSRDDWQAMFERAVALTFNRATVDGDTSTNDTLYGLANGASGVTVAGAALAKLEAALVRILGELAYKLVQDGEGSSKVLTITVTGADSEKDAEIAARTVGHSQLVKTAMYGKDANWGRIVAALGRSGLSFDPAKTHVSMCGVELFKNEQPTDLDFDMLLKDPLQGRDISIDISLGDGPGTYSLLASDLGHEYIDVNADYRS